MQQPSCLLFASSTATKCAQHRREARRQMQQRQQWPVTTRSQCVWERVCVHIENDTMIIDLFYG